MHFALLYESFPNKANVAHAHNLSPAFDAIVPSNYMDSCQPLRGAVQQQLREIYPRMSRSINPPIQVICLGDAGVQRYQNTWNKEEGLRSHLREVNVKLRLVLSNCSRPSLLQLPTTYFILSQLAKLLPNYLHSGYEDLRRHDAVMIPG